MTEIQDRLLTMLKWFDSFCIKNNLTYFAIGGTLLGAIRHSGFIPWDDDIDIALPRDDYNKLLQIFPKNNKQFELETPYSRKRDFLFSFSKLYDKSTTCIENVKPVCKRGLYIDIFPLDGIGSDLTWKKNFRKFDSLRMLLLSRTCATRKGRGLLKNSLTILMRIIPQFLIDNKRLSIKVDKTAAHYSFNKSEYVGNLMGAYRIREVFPKAFLGKPTRYKFENIEIYGPENYDAYLSHIYKNWRQLPPEDKRHGAHSWLYLDLHKPYRN